MNKIIGCAAIAIATLATIDLAQAADQVCEGQIHSGHRENATSIYLIKDFEKNKNPWQDIRCWFDSASVFTGVLYDTCIGKMDHDDNRLCKVTGVIRMTRKGVNKGIPEIISARKIENHYR